LKNKILVFVITCLLSISCVAQKGVLILNQSPRIDTLLMKQRQIHAADSTIDGYRVQIFMELGNDALKHADSVMTKFSEKYPDVPIYLIFGQPYYRLRIGDFRTRLEAEHMYQRVKKKYKNAFVTADRINLPYIALCSNVIDWSAIKKAEVKEKVFVEEDIYVIDTLLLDSLMYNDSINAIDDDIFYDE